MFAFDWRIYQAYKTHVHSHNVETIVTIANKIWLDYLINLIMQLHNFPRAKLSAEIQPKYYLRFSDRGDIKDARRNATAFIMALNKLYAELKFGSFLKTYHPYYREAIKEVRQGLPGTSFLPAMESFYRSKFYGYYLIPSLTIPSTMGFGVNYGSNGKKRINNVFGPLWFQVLKKGKLKDMGFRDKKRIRELSTHEFGHSFVNPVIDSIPQSLIENSQHLFDTIKTAMANQGYDLWKVCLYEHFVRAGEIIITRNFGYTAEANSLLKEYIDVRKFIYLPVIIAELEKYNVNPKMTYEQAVKLAIIHLDTR